MSEEKETISLTDDEEDDMSDSEPGLPELQMTLSKWTNYIHGWQERFIVLKDLTLSYYKSENDTAFGCRGAISLSKAVITPHQFDECRFDVSVSDCLWYLRTELPEQRQEWINALEIHKQSESGYGSENNLRRHGSLLSITSGTSTLSTTSASSFKRGRGLREKLAEMETFRDILCKQVETLQGYFDACSEAVSALKPSIHDSVQNDDDIDDVDDLDTPRPTNQIPVSEFLEGNAGTKDRDMASIFQQHGAHALDFKGESFTFKATTAGIIATLSHCIDLMQQREEAWRKRLEREIEKRKKYEEAYKAALDDNRRPPIVVGGPDYEEGPHCAITEDEFFDAVDATLDKLDREDDERTVMVEAKPSLPPKTSLSPTHPQFNEINSIVLEHMKFNSFEVKGDDTWEILAEDGEMKVFRRQLEEEGMVVDPLKAVHTIKGVTGHEICHFFWDVNVRMEWENKLTGTLENTTVLEWLSEDTVISYQQHKKVWPTAQRESLFWSHIRHVPDEHEDGPDYWIVVNYSTEHPKAPSTKCVRLRMNIAMICQTIVAPPADGKEISRDDLTCKIQYVANVNPGGWAPPSALRIVYKREYPKFLRKFTQYVKEQTESKPIMF